MEVILLTDVEKVGLRGEVVNVSRGYMRNYLGPRRLAEPATAAKVAELEKRESERAKHEARSFEQVQEIAETLRKTVLRFDVNAGPQGTLFGSVTATDIADELWRTRKIRVDRRKIALGDSIKRIGRYEVPIDVFQDVRVEVKTLVVPEGGELPPEEELKAMEEAARAEEEPAKAAESEGEESWSELLEDEPEDATDPAGELEDATDPAGEPEGVEAAEPGSAPEVDAEGGTSDSEDAPDLPSGDEPEDLERS